MPGAVPTITRGRASRRLLALVAVLAAALVPVGAVAQTSDEAPPADQTAPAPAPTDSGGGGVYKPPLRGAPGGRIGGASRSAVRSATALPSIELIAPRDHTGETASATPTLYFYASQAVAWPTQLTISAPLRPAPILEVMIPSPPARGLYALRLADYRVQLEPGIVYTWSVSAIVDDRRWARNVVASATIERVAPQAQAGLDAARLAGAGLWYDAVAAASAQQNLDRHATLDELLTEVGLTEPASFDRAQVSGAPAAR